MKIIMLSLIGVLFHLTILSAQIPDSLNIQTDSLATLSIEKDSVKKKKFLGGFFNLKDNYPSPKKAIILGLMIPGGGQIYNKKFWKLPIVYTGMGALIYSIQLNGGQYRRFKKGYLYRVDEDPCTIDEFVDFSVTEQGLKSRRDQYQKRMELSYIGLVIVHILSSVEAFTDAHLASFDVDEDLTIKLNPTIQPSAFNQSVYGFGINFNFNKKNKESLPTIGLIAE